MKRVSKTFQGTKLLNNFKGTAQKCEKSKKNLKYVHVENNCRLLSKLYTDFLPVELLCSKVLLKLAAATVDEVEGEGLTGDEQLMLA